MKPTKKKDVIIEKHLGPLPWRAWIKGKRYIYDDGGSPETAFEKLRRSARTAGIPKRKPLFEVTIDDILHHSFCSISLARNSMCARLSFLWYFSDTFLSNDFALSGVSIQTSVLISLMGYFSFFLCFLLFFIFISFHCNFSISFICFLTTS